MNNESNVSRRRNPEARVGFVNFPVDKYENTGEGGVFVRLVVMDGMRNNDFYTAYLPCCGGFNQFSMDECFLGDDLLDRSYPADDAPSEVWRERDARLAKCEGRYFPNLGIQNDKSFAYHLRYFSEGFLCAMTIGATGWSSSRWVCTFDDLTPDGTALVDSLRRLYPGCEIRLLTFLDT